MMNRDNIHNANTDEPQPSHYYSKAEDETRRGETNF